MRTAFCFDRQGAGGDNPPMSSDDFAPDCTNCAALCCIAFAFDKGEYFAHDKDAGEGCKHLDQHRCTIHADLAARGYAGCIAYDCLGAGQRVTAIFGQSWRDVPKLTGPMMHAFRIMRDIQDLRQLLGAARALPLPADKAAERDAWLAALESQWTRDSLDRFDANGTAAAIRVWLRGLACLLTR